MEALPGPHGGNWLDNRLGGAPDLVEWLPQARAAQTGSPLLQARNPYAFKVKKTARL